MRNVTDVGEEVDLESDMATFVSYEGCQSVENILSAQSEIFLGQKFWVERDQSSYTEFSR